MIKFEFKIDKIEPVVKQPSMAFLKGEILSGTVKKRDVLYLYDNSKKLIMAALVDATEPVNNDQTSIKIAFLAKFELIKECKFALSYDKTEPLPFDSENIHRLGICLQGGGIKGAFGVGAIHYLTISEIINPKRRLSISSASTGSLTSLILAENNGIETSNKAIEQYTSLFELEDMLELKPEIIKIKKSSPQLSKVIDGLLNNQSLDLDLFEPKDYIKPDKDRYKKTIGGAVAGGVAFGALGAVFGAAVAYASDTAGDIANASVKFIQAIVDLSKVKGSIAYLNPVYNKLKIALHTNFDSFSKKIENNQTTLRMAVVSIDTGALCYITENGDLLYPRLLKSEDGFNYNDYVVCPIINIKGISKTLGATNPDEILISGAVASGSFPAIFEPQAIEFNREGDHTIEAFFDGGIRENQPLEVLVNQDIQNIISIYCSPMENAPLEENTTQQKVNPNILSMTWSKVAETAISYIQLEGARNDSNIGKAMNINHYGSKDRNSNIIHIAPTIPTLSLIEIVPFNIKITIWYGYLRAYDELFIAKNRLLLDQLENKGDKISLKSLIRNNTEDLYLLMKGLYVASKKLIENCAYRVPIEVGGKNNHYVTYKNLKNHHVITYMTFHEESLTEYLTIKKLILEHILIRISHTKGYDNNAKKGLMYGENGLMLKMIYTDWYGVYEYLDKANIAINKRGRLKLKFQEMAVNHPDFRLFNSFNDKIFKDNAAAPKKETEIGGSKTLELKNQIKNILESSGLFEGSLYEKFEFIVPWANDDQKMKF